MGASFVWHCPHCGYKVTTSGPWEFYRDASGNIKPYGHPAPTSPEAESAGISGLLAYAYCANCDAVRQVILVEFRRPHHDPATFWVHPEPRPEPMPPYSPSPVPICPVCFNPGIVYASDEDCSPPRCPRCRCGVLEGQMQWIS
jgi:hypothetical protein